MKKKLSISTNKKSASEGEFIDVEWNCDACPDSLLLVVDSGYNCHTMPVADSGTTRIMMSRSKRKTTITLKAFIAGKRISESISVRVKNIKRSRAAKDVDGMKMRKEKLHARWCVFRAQVKYWWLSLKKWQKALWIALLALWLGMLVVAINGEPKSSDTSNKVETTSLTESEVYQNRFV